MDIAQTHEWVRAALAVAGALSIYLGYRLFCGLSYRNSWSILLTNLASGALLAIFGLGILIAGVRGIPASTRGSRPAWQKKSAEERSFGTPKFTKHRNLPDRLV
jgi:hypothetical protein